MEKRRYSPVIVYGALTLAVLFWGFSYVWSTIVFKYWTPITAIFVRLVFCTIILFTALKITKKFEKIKPKDLKLVILSGSLCPFLYFIFEGYGLIYSTPTICSVIISTIPIFSAFAAFIVFREKLSSVNIIGMFISFVGVFFIIIKPDYSLAAQPIGLVFLSLCVLSSVFHVLILRKLCDKYNPFTVVAYEDLVGAILFLPMFLIVDFQNVINIPLNFELIAMMSLLIIFAGSLAFPFHAFGLREIGVSRSNVFSNIIPVFTAIASFFFLNESFTWMKIAGMLLVIGGVSLVQLKNSLQKNRHHSNVVHKPNC